MLKNPHWIYSPSVTPKIRQHRILWIPPFGSDSTTVRTAKPASAITVTGSSSERKLNHISSLPVIYSDSGP